MGRPKGENKRTGEEGIPYLRRDEKGLFLVNEDMELSGDLVRFRNRIRSGSLQRELLYKASRQKHAEGPLTAIDATAGLGEDSLILAAAGYEVTLLEHNAVIADLLEDAMDRAAADPELAPVIARMHLIRGDSIKYMKEQKELQVLQPDLIYLDPMFPEKQKNSLTGKKLQMLQMLEIPCPGEEELLAAALDLCPKRIVIKRPLKGPYLDGREPSYSIRGKTVRYDCIVLP